VILFPVIALVLAGAGLYCYANVQTTRAVDNIVSLRQGAPGAILRKRAQYRGGRKARRARQVLGDARRLYDGMVRRPDGWRRVYSAHSSPFENRTPSPLALYVYEDVVRAPAVFGALGRMT